MTSKFSLAVYSMSCIIMLGCSSSNRASRLSAINISEYTSNKSLLSNMESISKQCNERYVELQSLKEKRQRQMNITASVFSGIALSLSTYSASYSIWRKDKADSRITSILAIGAGATSVPSFFYFGSDKQVQEYENRLKEITTARVNITKQIHILSDLGAQLSISKNQTEALENQEATEKDDEKKNDIKSTIKTKKDEQNKLRYAIWTQENSLDQEVISWSSLCY